MKVWHTKMIEGIDVFKARMDSDYVVTVQLYWSNTQISTPRYMAWFVPLVFRIAPTRHLPHCRKAKSFWSLWRGAWSKKPAMFLSSYRNRAQCEKRCTIQYLWTLVQLYFLQIHSNTFIKGCGAKSYVSIRSLYFEATWPAGSHGGAGAQVLNASQEQALREVSGRNLGLIQGPPGTGELLGWKFLGRDVWSICVLKTREFIYLQIFHILKQ